MKPKLKYLSREIQYGLAGEIGGAAMTNFKCKLCSKEDIWGSTAVPDICSECADKIAESILERWDYLIECSSL